MRINGTSQALLVGMIVLFVVGNIFFQSVLNDHSDSVELRHRINQQQAQIRTLVKAQKAMEGELHSALDRLQTGQHEAHHDTSDSSNDNDNDNSLSSDSDDTEDKATTNPPRHHRHHHHHSSDSDSTDPTPPPHKRHKKTPLPEKQNEEEEDDDTPPPKKKKVHTKRHGIGIEEQEGLREKLEGDEEGTIAVVMFTYKRAGLFTKAMDRVLKVLAPKKNYKNFRIFASQDGRESSEVSAAIDSYASHGVVHLTHERNDSGATPHEKAMHFQAYYAISHHFGWALKEIFSVGVYQRVIILEEDLEVASDFFTYMQAMSPIFDEDDTVLCVSSWNDNGKAELITSATAVYRSDFFPGLGWMMSRALWTELEEIWPAGFWDDWLRQPSHRKGRACIRPEVPRSFMWCDSGGVSKGQFCSQYLSHMQIEEKPVNWKKVMKRKKYVKGAYDEWLDDVVESATVAHGPEGIGSEEEYKIYYTSNREYVDLARQFGLMTDFKDNVPRTAYKGIVTFRWKGSRVHLVSRMGLYT